MTKSRLLWYVKQLFPLTYRSHYGEKGQEKFCVWKQWFNRPYKIEHINVCTCK